MKKKMEPASLLILVFVLALGAYAWILPAASIGFPVTDGGLFYLMTRAIQENGFALPHFVSYNGMNIPFAYPPLGFYLAASVSSLFDVSLIQVLRWLPAVLSIIITIAFYPLAFVVLKTPFKASLAVIFFALLPRSAGWYLMGGGITRAPGQIFLLLTLYAAYQLFTEPRKKYLWMTILFGAGAVLSHPEQALHAAALSFLLWAFLGRSKEGIKHAGLAALGILILAAPFYLTVLSRHGLTPYLNALGTGFHSPTAWVTLLTGSFADEKFITVISALALLGLVISLAQRAFLLPAMLILPALVDPRSAASISIIAWSLLAAIGFADVVIAGLHALQNKRVSEDPFQLPLARAMLAVLIFYSFFGLVVSDQVYAKVSLTLPQRAALTWVKGNIPPQSRFVIVTGGDLAFADAFSEWFPALTQSVSLATVQGYEWISGKPFITRLNEYNALQSCLLQNQDCVEQWTGKTKHAFEYVLVTQKSPLVNSFSSSTDYKIVYDREDIFIFTRK